MIEAEVARLRKLRNSALRLRAVARALANTRAASDDPVLDHTACAAWRVARAASGRLRAHPNARFQRDAGLDAVFANALVAAAAVVGATSRARAFREFSSHLRKLSRELQDARALTWAPDLSDAFGRSLSEFRPLLAQAEVEARQTPLQGHVAGARGTAGGSAAYSVSAGSNSPYLAL